jgi:hyperosmotically inducible periplasmic protein
MKTTRSRFVALAAIVLLAPMLLGGCGRPVGTTAVDDATITTRVRTSFINDPVVGGLRIDVDTFKGVVTLSGRVKTKEEEQRAIELARQVRGVTEVKSALQIEQ